MTPPPSRTPVRPQPAPGPDSASRRPPRPPGGAPPLPPAVLPLAALLLALAWALPAPARADGDSPAQSFHKASDSLDIQTAVESFQNSVESLDIQTGPDPRRVEYDEPIDISIPTPLIVGLALAIALIVAWPWIRNLRLPRKDPSPEAGDARDPEGAPIDAGELGRIRLAAETLAGQGRFSEAVHALLLETIELIRSARRLALPPSLTSREIASRLGLGGEAEGGLQTLVSRVEPTWFGLKGADESVWLECRAAHERLVRALADRGEAAARAKSVAAAFGAGPAAAGT